jgi:Ser/Thr protein kinase RdoA (MazF antagonist)
MTHSPATSHGPHAVHGMGHELSAPHWPPLTDDEVAAVLGRQGRSGPPAVTWRSPRPMSAAALVRVGDLTVFVKRHHISVRNPAQLGAEHALIGYLRDQGQPVPAVLRLADGQSVLRRGPWCYEAHELASGVDLYRDVVSWSPYAHLGHAYAAGAALARLHLAAADFPLPARPPAVLMDSCQVITAADPLAEVSRLTTGRPDLAAYLAQRGWPADFEEFVAPLIRRAVPRLAELPRQWGHGDWHPSNLTWTSAAPDAQVAGIFDFGLVNRTFAVHDLAVALERAVVAWLDLPGTGQADVDLAAAAMILDGYQTVRPLSAAEATALPHVLPVVHIEYALSEVDYFASITRSAADAGLAYAYLVGHARWFAQPPGAALLDFLARHLRAGLAVTAAVGRGARAVRRAVRVVAVLLLADGDEPGRGPQAGVINLQGGVGDVVLAAQEALQVSPDRVAVLAGRDQYMRRGRGLTRGDLPDMQVMDLGDIRPGRHRGAHRGRIEPGGRGLEEDPSRFPDQPGTRVHHQRHDDQGGDRVGPGESGEQDDQPRDRGGGERVQVGDDMPEGARQVQAPRLAVRRAGDEPGRRDVDDHAGQRHAEHGPAGHRRRRHQPADRRIEQPGGEQDQGDAVGLGGHDLGAFEPVGVPAGRRAGGQPCGHQHQRDRRGVGQHVRGVGDQCERMRGQARHDLPSHERQDQREGSGQPPRVRAARRAVLMPVSSCHDLTISSPAKDRNDLSHGALAQPGSFASALARPRAPQAARLKDGPTAAASRRYRSSVTSPP